MVMVMTECSPNVGNEHEDCDSTREPHVVTRRLEKEARDVLLE